VNVRTPERRWIVTLTVNPLTNVRREVSSVRSLLSTRPVLSLHGSDPITGIPATWHVTSLSDDGASESYLIERAEGDIHSPALWMQAQRDALVVGEDEVLDLVRAVMFSGR
jgi:hypothetical protein